MKNKFLFVASLIMFGLTSCSSEEQTAESVEESFGHQVSAHRMVAFPEPDKSTVLNAAQKKTNFNRLIRATDPQRALDWSMLEITEEQFNTIKAKADELCASLTDDVKKLRLLTKWVHEHVSYDYADNNAYKVFTSGRGVCQGYANLLKAMCISQGIPCVGVNGWYVSPTQYAGHAWTYAYANSAWQVADPTNSSTSWSITSTGSYEALEPDMADITLFEDENFEYNYYEANLNVWRVKTGQTDLVVPFSTNGFRISMFNPHYALPTSIQNIYLGSNIKSLGQEITGLVAYPSFDEMCYVDPANTEMGSYKGVVYNKDYRGNLTSIKYIPAMMKTIELMPIEKVEKNTIYHQAGVETIVFVEGTKYLEAYAIEDCPNLRTIYIPEDCEMDNNAIWNCPNDVDVIVGFPTGIKNIRY